MTYPSPLPSFGDERIDVEPDAPEIEPYDKPVAKPKPRARKPRSRAVETVTPKTVRRILNSYTRLQGADVLPRKILAGALAVENDPADIVAALASQARTVVPGVSELLDIVDAAADGAFAAMAKATQHEDSAKSIWLVLTALDRVTGTLPTKPATAAMTIAEAATKLDENQQRTLEATIALTLE